MKKIMFILIIWLQLYSQNNAQTFWQLLSKLTTSGRAYYYEIKFNSKGHLFFLADSRIYRSTDSGIHWSRLNSPPESYTIHIVANDRILEGAHGEIFVSDDNGDSWWHAAYISNWGDPLIPVTFAICKDGTILLSAWEGGIFQSWDNGSSWTKGGVEVGSNEVEVIEVMNNGKLYASSSDWIFESTDNGNRWKNVSRVGAKNNSGVTSMAITKNNSIYVGMGHDGVYVSHDFARSWQRANTGIETKPIASMAVDSSGTLWAGTDSSGVFYSRNNGTSWKRINSGLTDSLFIKVEVGPDGYVYAGTAGGNIFRSSNPVTSMQNNESRLPTAFYLYQNYPNPFNPTTTINYSIPKTSFVSIEVYDVLGKRVSTLVNEEKTAGNYSIKFDGRNLSSGIYFYRLQSEDFSQTKKFVLLK